MTKIPSIEETLNEVEKHWDTDRTEATIAIMRYARGQRTALMTELRDSELLEEKDMEVAIKHNSDAGAGDVIGHNYLARAIKAYINNLINPTK